MDTYIDLYLRKSKVVRNADPRDLLSVEDQEARGRAWAEKNGYSVRRVWVDNLSAWSDIKRPEFDAALSAVLGGEVPCLWCAFLDRFSRKGVVDIIPILGKARVVFDYEGLDSSHERDRRWIIDRAEQAREYSSRLSFNVQGTKALQRGRGQWLIGAPYGFDVDPKTKKLRNSDDWHHVLHLFHSTAQGTSLRRWCVGMNTEGHPSPRGGTWGVATAHTILNSPVYEGWQVVGGGIYRDSAGDRVSVLADDAKPVPPKLVAKARAVSAGQWRIPTPRGKTAHLLSGDGLTSCVGCKGPMPVSGRSHTCSRHATGHPCPAPASAHRELLESYVRDRWISRLAAAEPDDPLLAAVASRYAALQEPESSAELQEATAALRVAEEGVQRLAEQMAAGLYKPPFDKHLPRLQDEARAALDAANARLAEIRPISVDISWLLEPELSREVWKSATTTHRRELLDLAISKIFVRRAPHRGARFDGDSRVEIIWHEM